MTDLIPVLQLLRVKAEEKEITFQPPASEAQILEFERVLGMPLPEDFRLFYQHCNGFFSDEDDFGVTSLEEVVHREVILEKGEYWFAEYKTYYDSWKLQIAAPPENHYFICEYQTKVTNNLAIFLRSWINRGIFEPGGLYDLKAPSK